jgi:hypothetical protein
LSAYEGVPRRWWAAEVGSRTPLDRRVGRFADTERRGEGDQEEYRAQVGDTERPYDAED